MTSKEIRNEVAQGRGDQINDILLGEYIGEQVKNLNIEKHKVVIFDKPISQISANVQYSKPIKLIGVDAQGRYIFEPRRENIKFTPILTFELIDALEMLEQKQYKVY